ncbi:conserved hypothetical protein [Candidatus Roizmanbacteria bacterium]|nr:conserved hypothetical protein [Candidatus Roizmanbacteria bacterium]
MNINKEILKTIKYFSFFAYYPTLEEIHTFVQVKISRSELKKELKSLKYTPPQYSIPTSPRLRGASKYQISKIKLGNWRFKIYVKLLSLTPQIKLVGLSGSISMMNAGEDDDIDLFIITAKSRLFTGRFIALVLAQLLGLRRKRNYSEDEAGEFFSLSRGARPTEGREGRDSRVIKNDHGSSQYHKDKVCLNLFFDENHLKVPHFKQTEFVGHEVLQMKPIIIKGNIYERFLEANRWVYKLFPNARGVVSSKYQVSSIKQKKQLNTYYLILNTFTNKIERLLKNFQLKIIRNHQTTELISNTQLWFHPDDFEKKIKI